MSDNSLEKYLAFQAAYKQLKKPKFKLSSSATNAQLLKCHNCGNVAMISLNAQLRAADEESSVVDWCIACGAKSVIV